MKKKMKLTSILVLTNILTVCLFLWGCPGPSEDTGPCYPQATTQSDFQGLNAGLVKDMIANYRDNQLRAINSCSKCSRDTLGDTRSVWFSLETLKRFIYEIENKTCSKCINTDTPVLGLRIYFAAYPSASQWTRYTNNETDTIKPIRLLPDADPSNPYCKHTIIMIPTYYDESLGKDIDFDPNGIMDGCSYEAIRDMYYRLKNDPYSIDITALSSLNGTMQNHGSSIPPPFDAQGILDEGAGYMFIADTY